jgi:hypothetical protein
VKVEGKKREFKEEVNLFEFPMEKDLEAFRFFTARKKP